MWKLMGNSETFYHITESMTINHSQAWYLMEDHDQNVFGALDELSTAGFTLNGKKCKFRMQDLPSLAMTSAWDAWLPVRKRS